jgi:zinc-finger-containing domain
MQDVTCPYCGGDAGLYTGSSLFPRKERLHDEFFYRCEPCDAIIGCYPGTTCPKGILANRQLQKARLRAHKAFDPLWEKGFISRSNAYEWLARQMRVHIDDCHMSLFDLEQCRKVVEICNSPEIWRRDDPRL